MIIGLDASRNRSGGAIAYIIGILDNLDPGRYRVNEIHLWGSADLLDAVPDKYWLRKHYSEWLGGSLWREVLWQAFVLPRELREKGCDILFSSDASTVCPFSPMITMSQDLLTFDKQVRSSKNRTWREIIRAWIIARLQILAFNRAKGVIFQTNYGLAAIKQVSQSLGRVIVIPHGVGADFKAISRVYTRRLERINRTRCVYISPVLHYKHFPEVTRAIHILRRRGYNVEVLFVGGGAGSAADELQRVVNELDPDGTFLSRKGYVAQREILDLLQRDCDIFIFASDCESFGITLLEGMSAGLPIACSKLSSLPETLEDGGIYFDPYEPESIANSIAYLVDNDEVRVNLAARARTLSTKYSWERCSNETFEFISRIVEDR